MQFGSIGWSVGATLGYAQALKGKKRVIASIGDGSFQVTAQVIQLIVCMLSHLNAGTYLSRLVQLSLKKVCRSGKCRRHALLLSSNGFQNDTHFILLWR